MNERLYFEACKALVAGIVAMIVLFMGGLAIARSGQEDWARRQAMRNVCRGSLAVAVKNPDCEEYWQEDHTWADMVQIERARRNSCANAITAARIPEACRNID